MAFVNYCFLALVGYVSKIDKRHNAFLEDTGIASGQLSSVRYQTAHRLLGPRSYSSKTRPVGLCTLTK